MSEQQKFLFEVLDISVDKYSTQSKKLKKVTFGFRILVLFLAGTSTVLLGLNMPDYPGYLIWSRNLALVLGAVSTFVVGLGAFWNLETYWIKSKVLFARVRALRERCLFLKSQNGVLSTEEIQHAFNEYRSIMESQIEYWEKIEDQKEKQPKELSDYKNVKNTT